VAAEVWSLGATVYTLLAGRSPFERAGSGQNSRDQLRARIGKAQYTPIARPDVPASLEALLARSMSKNPADRQRSALEFAYELQLVQHELGLAHTPLEVADDEWAAAGVPIDFQNDALRGPVRPSVQYESRRAKRSTGSVSRGAAPDDGTVFAGASPRAPRSVSLRTAVLIAVGAAVVVAAAVTAALLLWGGR